ncbi:MAG: hypothetical protein ABA06_02245 [Parcubacteria bacterium C7867-001]|nr:MAG: hypothetical protein ABA06_02245 [Parcubacteria bacterium C7867-001]
MDTGPHEPRTGELRHIGSLMPKVEKTKSRATERGELMRFFQRHLNYSRKQDGLPALSMPRLGRILEGIPTKDLYYLKSVCTKAKNFSKKFWWEVDPKKHETENPF